MASVLIFGLSWLAVSVVAALLVAGSIRIAERRRTMVAVSHHDDVVDPPTRSTPLPGGHGDSGRVVFLFPQRAQRSFDSPRRTSGR